MKHVCIYLRACDDKLVVLSVVGHGTAAQLTTNAVQLSLTNNNIMRQCEWCVYCIHLSFHSEVDSIDGITGGNH